MTLRITLTVGREVVDEVSISRMTNTDAMSAPDDVNTYIVARKGDENPVTVEHRYGDGAPRLAEIALHRLRTDITVHPEMSDVDPEMSDVDPEMSDVDPEMSDVDPEMSDVDRSGRCKICRHRHEMGNPWTEHPCRWCKRCDQTEAGQGSLDLKGA